jgi:hypothetical protein
MGERMDVLSNLCGQRSLPREVSIVPCQGVKGMSFRSYGRRKQLLNVPRLTVEPSLLGILARANQVDEIRQEFIGGLKDVGVGQKMFFGQDQFDQFLADIRV